MENKYKINTLYVFNMLNQVHFCLARPSHIFKITLNFLLYFTQDLDEFSNLKAFFAY